MSQQVLRLCGNLLHCTRQVPETENLSRQREKEGSYLRLFLFCGWFQLCFCEVCFQLFKVHTFSFLVNFVADVAHHLYCIKVFLFFIAGQ